MCSKDAGNSSQQKMFCKEMSISSSAALKTRDSSIRRLVIIQTQRATSAKQSEAPSLSQKDPGVVGQDPEREGLPPDAPQEGRAGEEQTDHRHQGMQICRPFLKTLNQTSMILKEPVIDLIKLHLTCSSEGFAFFHRKHVHFFVSLARGLKNTRAKKSFSFPDPRGVATRNTCSQRCFGRLHY